jgi:hypothetical protein
MWPDWVIAFVGDGRIALLALAVIGVEALLVLLFLRRRARIGSLILTMASGAGLLGALYAALSGASAGSSPSGWCWPLSPMPPTWAHGCSAATEKLECTVEPEAAGAPASTAKSPARRGVPLFRLSLDIPDDSACLIYVKNI